MESWRGRVKERGEKEESLVVEWQNRNIGEKWVVLLTLTRENKEIVHGASKVLIFFQRHQPNAAFIILIYHKFFIFILFLNIILSEFWRRIEEGYLCVSFEGSGSSSQKERWVGPNHLMRNVAWDFVEWILLKGDYLD